MIRQLERRLRLGMVGGGPGAFIGGVHRIAARLDDRYELVAAALSSSPEKSRSAGSQLRIPRVYGDYREMARMEAQHPEPIDIVAIATPNSTHFPIAKEFLDAGFHVICDKPMTTKLDDARKLCDLVRTTDLIFGVTYTYSGYPMIRQAREMIAEGELGRIRSVQVEYAQDWLATSVETYGSKQAEWRTDPEKSGPGGCLGDIATHAYHLACFTTGLSPTEIAAEISTFVPGRKLDDHVQAILRFEGGAVGGLWASQVAVGNDNRLVLRVYGERGGICWTHDQPNNLEVALLGEPTRRIVRGGPGVGLLSSEATRIPSGHPEGFLEAFAQLYSDIAEQVTARLEGRLPRTSSLLVPDVTDGAHGVQFIEAALRSSRNNSEWERLGRIVRIPADSYEAYK